MMTLGDLLRRRLHRASQDGRFVQASRQERVHAGIRQAWNAWRLFRSSVHRTGLRSDRAVYGPLSAQTYNWRRERREAAGYVRQNANGTVLCEGGADGADP